MGDYLPHVLFYKVKHWGVSPWMNEDNLSEGFARRRVVLRRDFAEEMKDTTGAPVLHVLFYEVKH